MSANIRIGGHQEREKPRKGETKRGEKQERGE